MAKKKKPVARFEVYSAIDETWCWRLVSASGRITADAGGYDRKADCLRAVNAVIKAAKTAKILVKD